MKKIKTITVETTPHISPNMGVFGFNQETMKKIDDMCEDIKAIKECLKDYICPNPAYTIKLSKEYCEKNPEYLRWFKYFEEKR